MKELVGENGELAIALLWAIAQDAGEKGEVRVKALEALLNRGFGKPTESVELLGGDGQALSLVVQVVSPGGAK